MKTKQEPGVLAYPSPARYSLDRDDLFKKPEPVEWPKPHRQPQGRITPDHERTVEQVRRALIATRDCTEASPTKLGGIPVLKGTRFSVAQLFAELADGDCVAEIADNFELDAAQIEKLLHALSMYLDRSSHQ